ncbi:MAG: hypothetical protein OIN87_10140 [Candidatus Methanoperedens sp.]|nr:hypothetical protein [Candidatus Methanoperedens sp.]
MKKISLFLFFLILWAHIAAGQALITVEVHDNTDAIWTMEKRFPLTNQTDIGDWEEFIKTAQAENQQELLDFGKRMEWFVDSAQKVSGRSMKAEDFKIIYDTAKSPSDSYGIVRYSFKWLNFSRLENSKIFLGDSFSEGMVLSQDNVLVIKIPDGYEVESTSPIFDKRDGTRLIWDGSLYRNFNRGEPALVLVRSGTAQWFYFALVIIGAFAAFILYTRKRKKQIFPEDPLPSPETLKIEDMKYEEMIERFLLRSGGEASQSDIINEIGLSKSRVSTILSQMKDRGKIIKIKNGKGNLIRIVGK